MPGAVPRLSEEQVRWFRARRSGLAGAGAESPRAAARAILGAQAQQEVPALFALSQRTRGRPTAAALRRSLYDDRELVRTWGQRDTLHVYDSADWPVVVAARRLWPQSGRRGVMPSDELLAEARQRFEGAREPLLKSDLFEIVPKAYLDRVAAHPGAGASPLRMATSRLVWCLAMEGALCLGPKVGAEQLYVPRKLWFPDLDWPARAEPEEAARRLARRYLAVHGPAAPADAAHHFGAKVADARLWLDQPGVVPVACGERRGLLALEEDLDELALDPPGDGWPVRLLPQWDTHLMRHKDKSWLLERPDEAPEVWRKAANVLPAVLARGRIVATWAYRSTTRKVVLSVSPLSGWRAAHRQAVESEARALAAHLELDQAEVDVAA
ncbi:MAG: crosslink repair DNA glycosylase YcaQ family protein [Thermoanaerobaculia bacterium]|nr:crosslink repair DNA glycosylase YcaQ family protein [Thermoanaerobaculia bacterium]